MTPERRRRAVVALTERFGVSRTPGLSRGRPAPLHPTTCTSSSDHRARAGSAAPAARRSPRPIPAGAGRWPTSPARREGWTVNKKRTQRLWRKEGLRRPQRCTKRRRIRPDSPERLRANCPNHVWAIDFQFDETADYRRLKLANIVDEFTRESLAMEVDRSITADRPRQRPRAPRGGPRRADAPAHGQRARTDLVGTAGLVPVHGYPDDLHRAGVPLGEPLRRVLQRPGPRRTSERRGVRAPSPKHGSLSRRGGSSTTPIDPTRRWAGSPPSSSSGSGSINTNLHAHSGWFRFGGPVRGGATELAGVHNLEQSRPWIGYGLRPVPH